MDRIVFNGPIEIGNEVILEGPPLEALRVLRPRVGDLITLTDAQGRDFRGRIFQCSKERASVLIFEAFPFSTESPLEVILLQALPEKEKMEWIIQKTTELGVCTIVPFKSLKSISLEEREAKQKKAHRWQEIATRAVRQSRRARVPRVEKYCSFVEALAYCREEGLKMLLWEKGGQSLKNILKTFLPRRIYLMVGPEGGFAEEEVGWAKRDGFIPIKLGERILRTETAAISLVAILQYELGDLGSID